MDKDVEASGCDKDDRGSGLWQPLLDRGHYLSDRCDRGHYLSDRCDRGHYLSDRCDPGHYLSDRCDRGHCLSDRCDQGHYLSDRCERGVPTEMSGGRVLTRLNIHTLHETLAPYLCNA